MSDARDEVAFEARLRAEGLMDLPKRANRFLSEHTRLDLDACLYHYCTSDALLSIVEKGEIWASDLRYVNDSRELEAGISAIADGVSRWVAGSLDETRGLYKELLQAAVASLSDLSEAGSRIFATSFSANGDELSQWRAYCAHGRGFALGIRVTELARLQHAVPGCFGNVLPCIYSLSSQQHLIDIVIGDTFLDYCRVKGLTDNDWFGIIAARFAILAPVMKDEAFSVEREVRLAYWEEGSEAPIRIRPGKSSLIPYVAIDLSGADPPIAINRLVVGPTPMIDLSLDAARHVRGKLPIRDVTKTKVPFREV